MWVGIHRYVDVSTVDGPTAKLISKRIRATGAMFLEVRWIIKNSLSFSPFTIVRDFHIFPMNFATWLLYVKRIFNYIANGSAVLIGSSFRLQKACRRRTAHISHCRYIITSHMIIARLLVIWPQNVLRSSWFLSWLVSSIQRLWLNINETHLGSEGLGMSPNRKQFESMIPRWVTYHIMSYHFFIFCVNFVSVPYQYCI